MKQESSTHVGVILGKNIGVEWTGQRIRHTAGHLSRWSEIGADAGGPLLTDRLADQPEAVVLFTVGNTAGRKPLTEDEGIASGDLEGIGKELKSEAEYMRARFSEQYPHLAERGFDQPDSWDTNTDAIEIRKLMEQNMIDPNNWSLSTIGFHFERALKLFIRQGLVPPQAYLTEELLGEEFAEKVRQDPLYKAEEKKEKLARTIQFFPVLGRFATEAITWNTNRTRTK